MIHIAFGASSNIGCLKVQFWVPYYLRYLYIYIYIYMFFMVDNIDIGSFADDNTPYNVGKSQCDLQTKLQKTSVKRFQWFHENGLKATQRKCHFLSSLNISTKFLRKLLGIAIYRKLNFNEHVTNLCEKTSKKIQPLARIFPFIPQTQKRLTMKPYIIVTWKLQHIKYFK